MPLFLEFHWEIASDGLSDSHGNGCFFSPSSFFLSILCSAPGKRRSHWYTHALHVVGPCLLVCSLKTKSLMAIYKQNTHKQALKPDIGSQPSSCSLRDLLTSLGLSFSISWWRDWYIHTLIRRNWGHLGKSRKALDDTRKLASSLCAEKHDFLWRFGTHRACALGLICSVLGLPETEPEALHVPSKSSVTELYPQPCFVLVLSRETGSVVAKPSLNLLRGCLALNCQSSSFHFHTPGWPVCVNKNF